MRMPWIILVAWCAASNPAMAWGDDAASGRIESDQARIEILGPGGQREIRTPEGFLRVEDPPEPGDEDRLGSFGIYHATALAADDGGEDATDVAAPSARPARSAEAPLEAAPPLRRDGLVDTTAPAAGADPCRPQRTRYLQRVLRMSGVDVDQPIELLDGLAGPAGPAGQGGNLLVGGFLIPGFDAVRPLAWDQELRSLARDLATCEARTIASTAVPPPPPAR